MKTPNLLVLISVVVLSSLGISFAQTLEEKKKPVQFLLSGAAEFGGDQVAEVYFTNGDSQSVNAGQGVSIAIGGQLNIPKSENFLVRGTIGYKYVTTQADNAHIRLTRVPIVLSANYMLSQKIRAGVGYTTHRNINFKADGLGPDFSMKGSNGVIFEVAYGVIGLTYTSMKYLDLTNNLTYSANSFGVSISGVFPNKK